MSQVQTCRGASATNSGRRRAGCRASRPTLANLRVLAKNPIHGGDRTDVHALVQQRRVDLGRGRVDELRTVQQPQNLLAFGRGERAFAGARRAGGADVGRRRSRSALDRAIPVSRFASRVVILALVSA